ncbi:uncharacterized protein BP01DRAFT_390633 [Aspergillus saccharolyticus JOP 1030-1]|uniref:Uncharacterized protein n=1 Tax=Aspergillus saccharolyticus JOP 1030-1 TaxID=1450539 RepID=A0A319A4B3_9EURO|nr:hypothetical protein BP01DRAFT_390633 [Aspergillus saccharolyticus JOP 1030-1]PYH46978.1 hypothetical protein BP01DRAFT_390633 [Aspergillus saccharolyticus JOP 1030-1]
MLFRFLSVTGALCLSSCAAAASVPYSYISSPRSASAHQINLPAVPCAFSDSSCNEALDSIAHLTIDFSTQNGVLLANKQPIFPASVPMQFSVDRKWDAQKQSVSVAYALDVRPLPAHPGAPVGDVYHLKLRLFDLHGRPVTHHAVAIGLVRDAVGNLQITVIDPNSSREHGHGNKIWRMKQWKSQVESYVQNAKEAVTDCLKTTPFSHPHHEHEHEHEHEGHRPDHSSAPASAAAEISHEKSASTKYPPMFRTSHNGQFFWTGRERGVLRQIRAIIFPALLGVVAGGVACVIGFILGRTIISVYFWAQSRRRQPQVPIIVIEKDEPLDEKEVLMERYSDFDPEANIPRD